MSKPVIALLVFLFVLTMRGIRRLGWRAYLIRVLIGIDQLANTILFAGAPDETISARCGRGRERYWYWKILARVLDAIDPGHVEDALHSEETGAHR